VEHLQRKNGELLKGMKGASQVRQELEEKHAQLTGLRGELIFARREITQLRKTLAHAADQYSNAQATMATALALLAFLFVLGRITVEGSYLRAGEPKFQSH